MTAGERQTFDIGPWPLGLNEMASYDNAVEEQDLRDDELVFLDNYEVTDSGFLRPRRGVHYAYDQSVDGQKWDWEYASGTVRSVIVLGTIVDNDDEYVFIHARVNGESLIQYSTNPSDPYSWVTGYTWAGTTETFAAIVRYEDTVYLIHNGTSGSAGGGLSFSINDVRSNVTFTLTTLANMKRGHEAFVWKDRLWVVNVTEHTVFFSKATDFTTWASPDGGEFKVLGDGAIRPVVDGQVLYLFNERSTYKFYFTNDPTVDGYLLLVNENLGGRPCFHEDRIYVVTHKGLYQFLGDQYVSLSRGRLNDRSIGNLATPFVVGNHLYFGWETGGAYRFYSMNLTTGGFARCTFGNGINANGEAWGYRIARWSNDLADGPNSGVLIEPTNSGTGKTIYYMLDDPDFVIDYGRDKINRAPQYRILTKVYDLGDPFMHKKIKRVFLDGLMLPIKDGVDFCTYWVMEVDTTFQLTQSVASKFQDPILHLSNQSQQGNQGFPFTRGRNVQFSYEPSNYQAEAAANINLSEHLQAGNMSIIRGIFVDYVMMKPRRPSVTT